MSHFSILLKAYIAAMVFFLLVPVLIVVAVALTPGDFVTFPPPALSLRWFNKVLSDPQFLLPLWNSFRLGCASTFLAVILAVPAAIVMVRHPMRGLREIQMFLLSPLSLPTIILATGLLFFVPKIGMDSSFAALVAGHTVIIVPYVMRTVFGVYVNANQEIEYAAAVHGAGPLRTFWYVTLPLIRPGILAGAIFAFLMSFDEVAVALLLTNTDTTTLPVMLLSYLIYNYDPAVAAISTVQIFIVIVALLLLERIFGVGNMMFASRESQA
ncbi:ABC transporter permease [Paralcaligenes sp. KSB-10]|jgi:putative spermidine/putrescine transport system permease protein|uniref:ABC transporter permease n=1 Tax=Paralcaligenes sp. KSB-10 TaxID=2901142 RepID=UPI001E5C6606|nr:ABC transporter permease [Paralcaligenes sp. KSB-10]UHL64399.1 ABC transporter permease [Paralcaligenes sp. KSB-10]